MIDPDLMPARAPLPEDVDAWCRTAVWDAVSWLHHGDEGQARQALLVGLHRARRAAGETGPVHIDPAAWFAYTAALARQEAVRP
ncbi:MAG: hypothetical protein M3524_09745 [Actinomycetota bacterium]|nr:hypothetical protein [Actinomycetota bacterium]